MMVIDHQIFNFPFHHLERPEWQRVIRSKILPVDGGNPHSGISVAAGTW